MAALIFPLRWAGRSAPGGGADRGIGSGGATTPPPWSAFILDRESAAGAWNHNNDMTQVSCPCCGRHNTLAERNRKPFSHPGMKQRTENRPRLAQSFRQATERNRNQKNQENPYRHKRNRPHFCGLFFLLLACLGYFFTVRESKNNLTFSAQRLADLLPFFNRQLASIKTLV